MENKAIKAICFDLDGVYFTPKGKNSFHQGLINEYGVSKEIVDDLMYRSPVMSQLVRGKISSSDFWDKVREMTGITALDEELTNRWVRDYEVDENVKKAVLKAKEKGLKEEVAQYFWNVVEARMQIAEQSNVHQIFLVKPVANPNTETQRGDIRISNVAPIDKSQVTDRIQVGK